MTPLDRAIDRVQYYVFDGHSHGLAIHKAAQDSGLPVSVITGELSRRKAAKKAPATYRSTVPSWAKD